MLSLRNLQKSFSLFWISVLVEKFYSMQLSCKNRGSHSRNREIRTIVMMSLCNFGTRTSHWAETETITSKSIKVSADCWLRFLLCAELYPYEFSNMSKKARFVERKLWKNIGLPLSVPDMASIDFSPLTKNQNFHFAAQVYSGWQLIQKVPEDNWSWLQTFSTACKLHFSGTLDTPLALIFFFSFCRISENVCLRKLVD